MRTSKEISSSKAPKLQTPNSVGLPQKLKNGNLFAKIYPQYNGATSPLGNPTKFPAIAPKIQSLYNAANTLVALPATRNTISPTTTVLFPRLSVDELFASFFRPAPPCEHIPMIPKISIK